MNGISGSTTIVTGGGSGIGREAALRFAEEGANVVVADVDTDGAAETADLVREAGGEATVTDTDVSDPNDVEAMVDTAVETYGGLDYAFNNAGIEGESEPAGEHPLDNWERVIDVNLKGVFLCMRYELPAMLESGGGSIVNTSSIAGIVGFPNLSPYVASKHGVIGLTKNAALEYSGEGVRVNAISPGVIETPMVQRSQEDDPEQMEQVKAATPIGRLGAPDEIGDAAVWLCSEDASFVTGETLVIDGGYVAQ
ncbi:SDR family oxidoreductase [Salinarchaeum laminariae]|uniref:SDR family oxidoreductase n=1 Tax=Salinarchaeum laminariae TaxID=869888 RepID=UPI0020BF1E34|nr:SDR family oxidoreductase [Salinarchaeum laminariae]